MLVYYSSGSGNTHRFVSRLDIPSMRITEETASTLCMNAPYILLCPSYSDGEGFGAVPDAVTLFLTNPTNQKNLKGIVATGNRSFGKFFAHSGRVLSEKYKQPNLYQIELAGTNEDLDNVRRIVDKIMKDSIQKTPSQLKTPSKLEAASHDMDYFELNAMLNLYDADGKIQFEADQLAAKQYFLQHVNQNTVFFHNLREKLRYLIDENYYEAEVFDKYAFDFVSSLYDRAYAKKFRFSSFVGAYKYYTGYTLKTFDGKRYLERYEDRVVVTALYLSNGDTRLAEYIVDEIMSGRFQPATPTFLNAGKKQRGELVSCFLLRIEDNMESIGRSINSALQLSKRGGGVALVLTNIRESGAPIKNIENQSSGIIPIMKLLEDSFSYANQLGARPGVGAVYLHAHHPDIMKFLDTKRENADEKVRIKTLSLGVVIPDITFEIARTDGEMYLFSPYDVLKVYGVPLSDIKVSEKYHEMVADPRIHKKKVRARKFFEAIAEVQCESGYPYIMFEDTVNRANPVDGRIIMSNLCSEILQVSEPSEYKSNLDYKHIGSDISCNLGSLNIAKMMESPDFAQSIEVAMRSLNAVSDMSNIDCVPSIAKGNNASHAIGLGQMNLHGYLAKEEIFYGSEEGIDFTNIYFYTVAYHALRVSNLLAKEKGKSFDGFEKSKYASGEYFDKYTSRIWEPATDKVKALFEKAGIHIPTQQDWQELKREVMTTGLYNRNLQAVPPTGSISYINHSTSSIHPIASMIEIRKEGKLGRVYYPAAYMTNENTKYYQDAYEIGPEKIIDTYAAATQHVDQGLSLTLFFNDTATTRDITKAQIYAWKKGIKTIYYVRLRQPALVGTEIEGCVSCSL